MTSLLRRLTGPQTEQRQALSFADWMGMLQFGGLQYPLVHGGTPSGNSEDVEASFSGYVNGAYKTNGVIFACMAARMLLFAEARFQFRQMRHGKPGDLFGTQALSPLEHPGAGATTGDLLGRMITDVDLAGNAYVARRPGALRRLRPDWVTIIGGSKSGAEIDTEVLGYAYQPGGPASGENPMLLLPESVAHFAPIPDPIARFRGMSWLSPIIDEILGDRSALTHKRSFFDNGAKLGYVVTMDSTMNPDQFEKWVAAFRHGHEGELNAYRTLFLSGGADVKTVGANLQEVDFAKVQGHGETRICAAARVPPIIVGLSEGLEAATYANYGQARRAFADLTMRPLWRNVAGSLASIIDVPDNADLWYDDRDIPFLQEDQADSANIQQTQAITIRELINAGYQPETVVKAVMSEDYSLLKHTGQLSVQLQEPGAKPSPQMNSAEPQAQLPSPS